jgi:hypothetical protein
MYLLSYTNADAPFADASTLLPSGADVSINIVNMLAPEDDQHDESSIHGS